MPDARATEAEIYPGDCAVWNANRRFWCTLPRGHEGPHASINRGQYQDRWTGGSRG